MNTLLTIVIISVLGPIIGSLLGVLKKPSSQFMYHMLSFAAGVMIAISFLELIPESIEYSSILICIIGIILGSALMLLLQKVIPHFHPELGNHGIKCNHLKKTSVFLLLGIFIHNFPEGLAIAVGSISNTKISLIIALAIAIHNIPEGICTSYPYYHCTGKRLKAFLLSSTTAIPILVGFLSGYYLFPYLSFSFIGLIVGITAGVMIYISADELIPCSCSKMTNHNTVFSFIVGVIFVLILGYI